MRGRVHERTRRLGLVDGRAGRQRAEAARWLTLSSQALGWAEVLWRAQALWRCEAPRRLALAGQGLREGLLHG